MKGNVDGLLKEEWLGLVFYPEEWFCKSVDYQ